MKVLVIDNDLNSTDQVTELLLGRGYEVVSAVTGQGGLLQAQLERPDLVLIDVVLPDLDGFDVCRSLRNMPHLAQAPILIHSASSTVEDKVAGFRAGANDYMVKPVAPAELLARVEAALGAGERPRARIITVWGSKGGVGVTTLAGNLAVALRNHSGKKVTLVDASVLAGTLGLMLNLPPQRTTADVVEQIDNLDGELLASMLTGHASGVRALLSAPWSTNGNGLRPEHLDRILSCLQDSSDYIVIDTAPSLDATTVGALQVADRIVVVLTPEMTALRNARLFVSTTQSWGLLRENLVLVLNRHGMHGGIKSKDIERSLQTRLDLTLPDADTLVTHSINRGVPLVLSHKRTPLARGIVRLAEMLVSGLGEEPEAAQAPRRFSLRGLWPFRAPRGLWPSRRKA